MSTFLDFICTLTFQNDEATNTFIATAVHDANFPKTNDPAKLACYLYLKLNPIQTMVFQKLLVMYHATHPDRLPKRAFATDGMALNTINLIIGLQNASAEYTLDITDND